MTTKSAEYPISANYCSKWSVVEGIREIIANALDTKQPYNLKWENGYGYVSDAGTGFPKECLILGEGETKDETQIGQFREGLKIAGLVFARNKRFFKGKTVGYAFNFRMAQSETFDCETLFVDFEANDRTSGTVVVFECSESELDIAKSLFIEGNNEAFIVPDRPGELFINKSFVQKIENAMYGYNISDKEAANRDRSILNMENVKTSIRKIWQEIEESKYIKAYLTTDEQHIEHEITFYLNKESIKKVWIDVIESLYGKKYCLYDSDEYAHRVREWGYRVINTLTYSMKSTLNSYLGIPTCADILENRLKEDYVDFTPKLSPQQLRVYNMALDIVELYYEEPINIMVVEKISFLESGDARAESDREENIIRITPNAIDRGLKKLVGSIVHEETHLRGGNSDSSRSFEADLTDVIGDVLVKLNKSMLIGGRNALA